MPFSHPCFNNFNRPHLISASPDFMAKDADPFSNDQRITSFGFGPLKPKQSMGLVYLRIFTYICLIFYGKLVGKSTSRLMDAMDAIAISMSTPPQCDGGPSTSPLLRFETTSTARDPISSPKLRMVNHGT